MIGTRSILTGLVFALAGGLLATPVSAQQYPARPITVFVPFPPAGIIDTLGRLVGAELSKRWSQPVVVENRPGAGGWIGVQQFSHMPPDGYTLLSGASSQSTGELFLKTASFEPGKDVQPVVGVAYAPYVIITNTQVPAKTLKDFISLVKASPGKLNFVAVPASGQLLDTLDFMKRAGMDMVVVPYQGGAAALRAVLANEGQAYFGAALGLEQNIQAGKLTALAVTSARPFANFPGLPTVKAATGIDFDAGVLYGIFTVPGTPDAIVQKLYKEIADIAQNTGVGDNLRKQSYEIRPTSPEDYTALINNELRRGREIAKAANIQPTE
jgi:tripartite-type tricarboxylate transporter receptor subunit TctC